ncbi:hypothetical protein [Paludibaculum fermentans]|uniref:hypothetical protein n=1 Tax=Paludibaculum fermentans TaxID=1473598 RepID=UPI003EB9F0EB
MRMISLLLLCPLAAQTFDAARVQPGVFDYTITDQQKEVARLSLKIARTDAGRYEFSADATAAVCQRWESTATASLEPIAALLRFCKDGPDRPIFQLDYAGRHVSGTRYTGVPPTQQKHAVDANVPDLTVDQRIDWAAVMALDLKPGLRFGFNVYDPVTGVSRLTGQVDSVQPVTVPAGQFTTYRLLYQMNKQGRVEPYESLVSRDAPRVLLKIRFPNGSWSDLVGMR